MLESNLKVVNDDVKTLVKDAQSLFQTAAELTGKKAEEVRGEGMRLLDNAMSIVQDAQVNALAAGRKMAVPAARYVKENPWRAVAVAVGAGLLTGLLLRRK